MSLPKAITLAAMLFLPAISFAQNAPQDLGNGYTYTPGDSGNGGALNTPDGATVPVAGSDAGWTATEPDGTVDSYAGGAMTQDSADDQDEDQAVSEGLKPDTPFTDPGAVDDPSDAPASDFTDPASAPEAASPPDDQGPADGISLPGDSGDSSDSGDGGDGGNDSP
jgi:hypothetical protein